MAPFSLPEKIAFLYYKIFAETFKQLDLHDQGTRDIEHQSSQSSGTSLPPVLLHDLLALRSAEFNKFVVEQKKRFMTSKSEIDFE